MIILRLQKYHFFADVSPFGTDNFFTGWYAPTSCHRLLEIITLGIISIVFSAILEKGGKQRTGKMGAEVLNFWEEKHPESTYSFSFSLSDFIRKTTIGKAMMDMVAEIGR